MAAVVAKFATTESRSNSLILNILFKWVVTLQSRHQKSVF